MTLFPGLPAYLAKFFLFSTSKSVGKKIPIVLWRLVTRSKYQKTKKNGFFAINRRLRKITLFFDEFLRVRADAELNFTSFKPKTTSPWCQTPKAKWHYPKIIYIAWFKHVLNFFPGLSAYLAKFILFSTSRSVEKLFPYCCDVLWPDYIIKKLKKRRFLAINPRLRKITWLFLNFWNLQAHSEFNSTSFEAQTRRRTAPRAAR